MVDAIAGMGPDRVVYVSCDPATLARDVKRFSALGYQAQRAEAVDLFPRTAHVETYYCIATKRKLVEILCFQHFARHVVFDAEGNKRRNKRIEDYITVSVVIDMECGNTKLNRARTVERADFFKICGAGRDAESGRCLADIARFCAVVHLFPPPIFRCP